MVSNDGMKGKGEYFVSGDRVPEIRFLGFEDAWIKKALNEVLSERKVLQKISDDAPILAFAAGQGVIDRSERKSNNRDHLTLDQANKFYKLTEYDDIVYNPSNLKYGAIDRNKHGRGVISPIYVTFTTDEKASFIEHIVKGEKFKLRALVYEEGTVVKRQSVKPENLLSLDVNISSSLEEQTKIGDFFQQIDRLISQYQQKHDKLLNIKKALLERMFPRSGKTEPEIRFKGFSGEWKTEPLEENADFSKGQGYSKTDLVESGSPIILYGRLYTKYETVIFKVDTFVIDNGKSIISKGIEVIVPASGEMADDIAIASAVVVPGILLGGDLNIIYPDEKINSIFLALSISNGSPRKDLSRRAQGKSVVHVRNSDLKELNISYPDVNEQTKIGNFFQQIDRLISQHQTQIQKLNHVKQAFLSKMFA